MKFEDWFDLEDFDHMKIYVERVRMGTWSKEIPEDVEISASSLNKVQIKLANLHAENMIKDCQKLYGWS